MEGRSLSAVAHLATLGVKYAGTGILGFAKDKSLSLIHILKDHRANGNKNTSKIKKKFLQKVKKS